MNIQTLLDKIYASFDKGASITPVQARKYSLIFWVFITPVILIWRFLK